MYSATDTTDSSGCAISGESSLAADGESGDGENKGARPIAKNCRSCKKEETRAKR